MAPDPIRVLLNASNTHNLSHEMWCSELDSRRASSQPHTMRPTFRACAASTISTPPSLLMLVLLLSGTVSACSNSEDTNDDATSSTDDVSTDTHDDNSGDAGVTDDDVSADATGDEATSDSTNGDSTNAEADDRDAATDANGDGPRDAQSPGEPQPDLSDVGVNVSDANGQTGSIGGAECLTDTECVAIAQGQLDALAEPSSVGSTFDQAQCIMAGLASGPSGIVCECTNEGGGSLTVGLDCARHGRHGECIYPADEFPGCELGVAESCDAVCSDLQSRLEAAAAQTYESELRAAYCDNDACVAVSRIEDVCHVNGDYIRAYDCSQSDEDIVSQHQAQQAQDQPPPCDSPEAEASDTCYETTTPTEEYYPRDPDEWQGMRVDISNPLYCDGFCGMALACIDQECLPCESDAECMDGEGCAMNHCVLLENIECRARADCDGEQLCLLSGYTGGTARANEDMRAYCLGSSGGSSM